jgi:hypothetical protein
MSARRCCKLADHQMTLRFEKREGWLTLPGLFGNDKALLASRVA